MTIDYELRISDAQGVPLFRTRSFLETGPLPGLSYTLNVGNVGSLVVTLPPEYNKLLVKDGRIGVWRSVNNAPAQLEGGSVFLIRRWDYAADYTVVTAVHANHILSGRISAYQTRTANSQVGGDIDADLKDIWDFNFPVAALGGQRALTTGVPAGDDNAVDITIHVPRQAYQAGSFPTISKLFTWRNILEVYNELCESSYQNGTYAVAEIIAPSESTLELQTFYGQRGQDRRFSTGSNLLFTPARGNLENAVLTVDAINEVTFAQAGGAGISTGTRYLATAIDLARVYATPFGRREMFVDDSNTTDVAALTATAQAAVQAGRPVIQAVGELVETDSCIRGVHYNFGDLVTVEMQGQQYDMHLDILQVHVAGGQPNDDLSGDLSAVNSVEQALRVLKRGEDRGNHERGYFTHQG